MTPPSLGLPDETFGVGGIACAAGLPDAEPTRVFVWPDASVALAGDAAWEEPIINSGFGVARLDPWGTRVAAYGSQGATVLPLLGAFVYASAPSDGGAVIVGGQAIDGTGSRGLALWRVGPDGALDATFGDQGRVVTPVAGALSAWVRAMAVDPLGRVVAAGGWTQGDGEALVVARYLPDGRLDPTFDGDGLAVAPMGPQRDRAEAIAFQPDGAIVIAGHTYDVVGLSSVLRPLVARYLPDGRPDPGFDGDGVVRLGEGWFGAVRVEPDGALRMVGMVYDAARIGERISLTARLLADGSPDPAFGVDGQVETPLDPVFPNDGVDAWSSVRRMGLAPDGSALLVGSHYTGTSTTGALGRVSAVGQLDRTFGAGGLVLVPNASGTDVAVGTDGALVMAFQRPSPGAPRQMCALRLR